MQDVLIDGFTVTAKGGERAPGAGSAGSAREVSRWRHVWRTACLGLYARHVDGLTLRNTKVHAAQTDARTALIADDVTRLELSGFASSNIPEQEPLLLFRNVAGALLYGNLLTSPANVFLSLTGSKCADVALRGNSLRRARKVVSQSGECPEGLRIG